MSRNIFGVLRQRFLHQVPALLPKLTKLLYKGSSLNYGSFLHPQYSTATHYP